MNRLVKANVLSSINGQVVDGCVLHMRSCSNDSPCPLHYKVEETRENIRLVLAHTKISDLLADDNHEVLRKAVGI
jgi:DNA-binding IscR family transcriptional regulator